MGAFEKSDEFENSLDLKRSWAGSEERFRTMFISGYRTTFEKKLETANTMKSRLSSSICA